MASHCLSVAQKQKELGKLSHALNQATIHNVCFPRAVRRVITGRLFCVTFLFFFNILHSFGALSSAFPSTLEFVRFHTVLPFYRRERSDFEGGKGARKAARRRRGKKSASAPARNFRVVHYYLKQARSPPSSSSFRGEQQASPPPSLTSSCALSAICLSNHGPAPSFLPSSASGCRGGSRRPTPFASGSRLLYQSTLSRLENEAGKMCLARAVLSYNF